MQHRVTALVFAILFGVSIAHAAASMSNTCHDDASGTVSGTRVAYNLDICQVADDTGSLLASVFIPSPRNSQITTSATSAAGVHGSYSISNWTAKPSTETIFTVDATAQGQAGTPGHTTIIITVGSAKPVVIIGYDTVIGTLNQSFDVPAGTVITITVLCKINGGGFVTVTS